MARNSWFVADLAYFKKLRHFVENKLKADMKEMAIRFPIPITRYRGSYNEASFGSFGEGGREHGEVEHQRQESL